MSEAEKTILVNVVSMMREMDAGQKERFVSWAEGVAFAMEQRVARDGVR